VVFDLALVVQQQSNLKDASVRISTFIHLKFRSNSTRLENRREKKNQNAAATATRVVAAFATN
jgi:2-iminoacetate synthase ThiH